MRSRSCFSAVIFAVSSCVCLGLPVSSWGAHPRHWPASAAKQTVVAIRSRISPSQTLIPGPLRPFERMAAISRQVGSEDVLPLFALNVYSHGYGKWRDKERGGRPTEYLLLVERYIQQARQLQALAGPQQVIRVPSCDQAKQLLDILGYRLGQPCGPKTFLETADPNRAFLTIDSGFPLTRLEQALRSGKPFLYPYASTSVPLLFRTKDWTSNTQDAHIPKSDADVIDILARDPALARLYWAMSRLDSKTRAYLKQSVGIGRLLPYAPVLDFYGQEICIRSGRVLVPGGPAAQSAWRSLVGASPEQPARFVSHLLSKDDGWAAAYYDTLARTSRSRQAYFTAPARLRTFYQALRNDHPKPGPARPVFRSDAGLLLLVSQLQFDPNGQPHIPGGLGVWKKFLPKLRTHSALIRKVARRADKWHSPDDLLAAMFAFSRAQTGEGPLQMYLQLSAIDRSRTAGERLKPRTVRLLLDNFARFHEQYLVFSDFPGLSNAVVSLFVREAKHLDRIRSIELRSNAIGMFQAEIGLWKILARQGEIPGASLNRSFEEVIRPFARVRKPPQLFDAGRKSFERLCRAATGRARLPENEFIALLAGPEPRSRLAAQVRQEIANRIRAVMASQRLVSLDTLFTLGSGLEELAKGKGNADALMPLAAQLRQFEMPQPIFTARQTEAWSYGLDDTRHTARQEHIGLRKIFQDPRSFPKLSDARGLLSPFLRDSLVGLDYAYYEPPGAQMERNDPLFVRSHDFSGMISAGGAESWQTPFLIGRGWTAGGGAHLTGSLADLPYVLADAEENFIVPRSTQALIWSDMVPTLLTDAVVPRWWGISRNELHAVALYQRAGEQLLAASAHSRRLRSRVMDILSGRMLPARQERIESALRAGRVRAALSEVTPADTFYLTARYRREFPADAPDYGPACRQLQVLSQSDPGAVSFTRLSRDFGVPHPTLAFTDSLQLLSMKPLPTFMGYSSRLLAESWDSDNLYWARLADQAGYGPVMLNLIVPELTKAMVANIFATYPGDWPALLRALRQTGEEFRQRRIVPFPKPEFGPVAPPVTESP